MVASNSPGVIVQQFEPAADLAFRTAVVGFIGPATGDPGLLPAPALFTSWPDFSARYAAGGAWVFGRRPDEWLWNAVQGFFLNGGARCWVVLYDSLEAGVTALADLDEVDLVCAPSLAVEDPATLVPFVQACQLARDDWFLIVDAPRAPAPDLATRLGALRLACARPFDVAVYQPWVQLGGTFELAPVPLVAPPRPTLYYAPPSGHVAGIYARTDQRVGVHKAPANEALDGMVDLFAVVADVAGANTLR